MLENTFSDLVESAISSVDVAESMEKVELTNKDKVLDLLELTSNRIAIRMCQEMDVLVNRFNQFSEAELERLAGIIPGVVKLKHKMFNHILPQIEEMSEDSKFFRAFLAGIHTTLELAYNAQLNRSSDTNQRIDSISLQTSAEAASLAFIAHTYERTLMDYFERNFQIVDWNKDDILFALEEIALLEHVQNPTQSPSLFYYLITNLPPEGLGWRKPQKVEAMRIAYQALSDSEV